MAKSQRSASPRITEPAYHLTEESHSHLRTVQDCLHLVALLTQAREEDPLIPLPLWTSFLMTMREHMKDVLDDAAWLA